ncbi:MAG TPA: hypothetical protein VER39_15955 [Nocardioidaceae bacterium]|nr:hypothetical protein [Nocardioidaceae bacterium]
MSPSPARPSERGARGQRVLAARASYVLRSNDVGAMTTAAPLLYPHMWSWDAAFISIGLATVSVPRAILEMDTLLAAQWGNGMIPHVVFSRAGGSYFPDADRWGCADLAADAPREPPTSGICQPPVHALALQRIVEAVDPSSADEATAFLDRSWPRLLAWHRWVARARDPQGSGRVTIHHGWESGMDNSPRWDGPYSRVVVGTGMAPYVRVDTDFVESSERPSDAEYARYLWLVEEMRRVGYDPDELARTGSFAVEDVFFSALLSVASTVLAEIGETHGKPAAEVAELRSLAHRFRAGVDASVDPRTGLARDRDLRTGDWLSTDTIAGFAPLLCGSADPAAEQRLLELFSSEDWCGHPSFAAALPPSTSPSSAAFRPTAYWRGPQWPVLAWLFSWAFRRHGWSDPADRLRDEALRLLAGGDFGEYYEPRTGEPLGSAHQSWTAAVALDWLSRS